MNNTDLIIVGSGVAGLSAALAAADSGASAMLVTADRLNSGSSWWAQGGVAAAVGRDDLPAYHVADTLAVGARLNDRRAVGVMVEEGRHAAIGLLQRGVAFEGGAVTPDLGLEAGHGHRRILHAEGGATGAMVSASLLERAASHKNIQMAPCTPITSLIVEGGRVVGVESHGKRFRGRGVTLATGGYAGLWGRSTNPPGNRGVGLCLAWKAGATLADLEFVQFHPTALDLSGAPAFLLSEALRGEGALLLDADEREIVDPLLARDVVARAVARHRRERGPVYLSMRRLDPQHINEHFASIALHLREWGLDLASDLLPVAPAAHYCMGGVRTDADGRTDVPGLYVAGEAACTGAQGANRLASNSLLECLVFGQRAALAALHDPTMARADWHGRPLPTTDDGRQTTDDKDHSALRTPHSAFLGSWLDLDLGVERDDDGLARLINAMPNPFDSETHCDYVTAGLAARSALLRRESRGAHHRADAPATDPVWQGRILWQKDQPPRFEEVASC